MDIRTVLQDLVLVSAFVTLSRLALKHENRRIASLHRDKKDKKAYVLGVR